MFDHDGVLVDSLAVFTTAFAAACGAHGHAEIAGPAQVVALFDDNVYDSMAALGMARQVIRAIIDDTAGALAVSPDLHPVPGVPELLAGLAACCDVVVITSNAAGVVRDFMARERLAGHVSDVLGVEIDVSKVRKIATVMARYPGQRRYFYVGDTRGDMLEGAQAGATPLGAGWGWHGAAALTAAGAAFVAATPAELLAFVVDGLAVNG
jgi:phosphoglycolate phosphatase